MTEVKYGQDYSKMGCHCTLPLVIPVPNELEIFLFIFNTFLLLYSDKCPYVRIEHS